MRKLLIVLLALAVSASLFAGGQSESGAKMGGYSVALLNASNDNSWRIIMEKNLQDAVDKYKAEGVVSKYVAYSANYDATLQSQQLDQLVNQGVDAVLINPVSATSLNPVIDKAIAKGIIIIGVDQTIQHPDAINVTNDQREYARKHVTWLVDQIGGKGKILQFNAVAGAPAAVEREEVYSAVLAKYPDIKVLAKVNHDWNLSKAKQLMTQLLTAHPDFDAILTQECTPAIIAALVEAGHPLPKAISGDESIQGLRVWAKYKYNSIMVENPPGIGADGLHVAVKLLQGGKIRPDALSNGNTLFVKPNLVITNDTRDQWVEKTKDLQEQDYINSVLTPQEVQERYFQ